MEEEEEEEEEAVGLLRAVRRERCLSQYLKLEMPLQPMTLQCWRTPKPLSSTLYLVQGKESLGLCKGSRRGHGREQ